MNLDITTPPNSEDLVNWRLLQLEAAVREMEKRGNQVFYLLIANLGGIIAVLVSRLVSWPH